MVKRKMRQTRMNIGRKRPRVSWKTRAEALAKQLERQQWKTVRLRRALKTERSRWYEKCPKGHLVRYDECDLVGCYVIHLEPINPGFTSVMPKTPASGLMHEWTLDEPNTPFAVDKTIGWWWRIPRSWWFAFKNWSVWREWTGPR